MKRLYSLLMISLVLILSAQAQADNPHIPSLKASEVNLTPADWQSDLLFLQQTVHKDYSFLFKNTTAEKFDAEVERLYKAMPKLATHEALAGIGRLVSTFKYGHTSASWRESSVKYHMTAVNFYWFSDGI